MNPDRKGKKIKDILSYLQEEVPYTETPELVDPTQPDEEEPSLLSPEQLEKLKRKRAPRPV